MDLNYNSTTHLSLVQSLHVKLTPQGLKAHNLFKRCLKCAPLNTTGCPPCKSAEVCTLIPYSCDQCAKYECQSAAESGAVDLKPTPNDKSPAPQIAGGVIGGVVLISLIVFVIWKYVLRGKRRELADDWDPMDYPMEKPGDGASFARDARSRASTHTVTSMASTVLTRASNVIQIAFIPGVTARQQTGAQTPNTLVPQVPPVPPVPIPTTPGNRHDSEQMLFLPGDLRDSAYTDISAFDGASRKSLSPSLARTSIASTVYQENAMAAAKAKPSLVSVSKAGSTASTPSVGTPPVPALDVKHFRGSTSANGGKPVLVQMPVSREGIGSSAGSIGGLKPKAVLLSKGKAVSTDSSSSTSSSPTVVGLHSPSASSEKRLLPSSPLAQSRVLSLSSEMHSPHTRAKQDDESDDSDDELGAHERSRLSLARREASPFSDAAALDGTTKAEDRKTESPFDDRNAVQ